MTPRFPISATVRAPGRFVDRLASFGTISFPVRYGLLEHPKEGVVLVDTGYGRELWEIPGWQAALYRGLLRPRLRPEGDVDAVLSASGMERSDVRHVVATHLHPDHVCGLGRFTKATIHVSRKALAQWSASPRLLDGAHGLLRGLLPDPRGMDVRVMEDAPSVPLPWGLRGNDLLGDGSIVSLPLPGHMPGHSGVLFGHLDVPLIYAVDVSWTRAGYRRSDDPPYPARLAIDDATLARASCRAIREAEEWGARIALCHDPEPLAEDE